MKYSLIYSKRKTISLTISNELELVIRAPNRTPIHIIDSVVSAKKDWIEKSIKHKSYQLEKYNISNESLEELKQTANNIILPRVKHFSKLMSLEPATVKITKAKTRFGSCNSKGNICFSCYLALYDPLAIDYVIVHELAHLVHLNHSKQFYSLIATYLPNYKECEKLLKQN